MNGTQEDFRRTERRKWLGKAIEHRSADAGRAMDGKETRL